MVVKSEDYKLEILKYAVNQSIDRLLPKSNQDALSVILYQSKEVIWKVATEIYTKSGHQVDFVFIRDLLNLRIEPLRNKIAEEERNRKEKEAEEVKIRARLEAERLAKIAEQKRIEKEQKEQEQKQSEERDKRTPSEIEREKKARYTAWDKVLDEIRENQLSKFDDALDRAKQYYQPRYFVDEEIFNDFLKTKESTFIRLRDTVAEYFQKSTENIDIRTNFFHDLELESKYGLIGLIEELNLEFRVEIPSQYIHYGGYLVDVRVFYYIICCLQEGKVIR